MTSIEISTQFAQQLHSIADQRGISIETLLLEWAEKPDEQQMIEDALYFIAQRGWKERGKNFFETLLTYLATKLNMNYALLGKLQPDLVTIESVAFYSQGGIAPSVTYALLGTPCYEVMGRKICYYPQHLQDLFPEDEMLKDVNAESYIGIPLWDARGNPIGILNLFDSKPLQNIPLAETLLQIVAVRASHELERMRDEAILADRLGFEQLLSSISTELVMWSEYEDKTRVQPILKRIQEFFDVDRCNILEFNDKQDLLIAHVYQRDSFSSFENLSLSSITTGYVETILNHQPFIVNDFQGQTINAQFTISPDDKALFDLSQRMRSHLAVPISVNNQVLGAVAISDYHQPHAWTETDVKRLRSIGELFGNALLRQKAEQHVRQRNRELEALLEISSAVGSTLQLDQVLDKLLFHLTTLVPYKSASIALFQGDSFKMIKGRGFPPGFDITSVETVINNPIKNRLFLPLEQPHIMSNVVEYDGWVAIPGVEYIRSCMSVPLLHRGVCIGIMYMDHDEPNFFTAHHATMAMTVARQAATAIENARLFEQLEQRVAERTHQLEDEICERQLIESALRAEKKQTETILNHIADGILFTDVGGKILYVNPAWERITGYSYAEAIGSNPNLLKSEQSSADDVKKLWETITAGKVWQGIFVNKRRNQVTYDAASTIVPVVDDQGKISHFVEVQRDVTEERQVAAMKERFIADAAHDLGNPVAVLQTSLYMLKHKPEKFPERLPIIEEQINRLTVLIRDLLTVSRLDRKALQPVKETFELRAVLHQVVTAQQTLASEKQLSVRVLDTPGLSLIHADRGQVERIVVNLISNAISYTRAGGRIIVMLERQRDKVGLVVQDTGIGIPAEDLPFLFQRFFRSAEAQQMSSGTGLGLAIVKEMVELNDGQIEVESTVGKGTTFRVLFPVGHL